MNARQIRKVRIANGISQKDFAEFIDMPQSSWSNMENGYNIPHAELLAKAESTLKELGCDFSVLDTEIEFPKHYKAIPQKSIIEGVGKEEPIVINEKGGGQSRVLYRFDLIDPKAILATTKVLAEGAEKYGVDNWRLIDIKDHLNHLIIHAYAYLAGDESDEHLSHAVCRALFALAVSLQEENQN